MMKPSILSLLMCLLLLLQLSSASATNYVLPANIGSGPFASCSGSGPTYTCTSKVDIGKNNTLVLNSDVTLNVSGEFKVADNSSVDKGAHIFNVDATKIHIDGSASIMVFDSLTATGEVKVHKKANLTADLTSTSGNINIDNDSTVIGNCIPSQAQCTTPPMVNPTVASQTSYDTSVIITGTYSSSVATSLTVTVNSVTYTLSTSGELTNSSDNWTLDLSNMTPLAIGTYQVLATSTNGSDSLSDTTSDELVIKTIATGWWDTNWTKCRNITIANTGNTTLSNFPAYIDLTYDSDMQSSFNDIRFINTSCANGGVELDFEIETYTAAVSADVWVEIDNLPAAGTTIAVYYGNASATSGENASGTWVSSHKGVWHLSESTDATNQDSTSYSNNGTPQSSPVSTSGKIGKALNFDVRDNTSIELGKDDSLDLSTGNSPDWTISLWVKPAIGFGDNQYPVMYAYGDYRATVGLYKDNGKIEHRRNDKDPLYNNSNLTTDAWHHVVVTRDNSKTTFYLNGNENGSGTSKNIYNDNYGSFIGGWTGTNSDDTYKAGDLKGVIDEVRVSNVVRSPDWIKQSYDLVQDQNDHVTIGDEVEPEPEPELGQCSAVFPDGGSTHSVGGTISFGYNSQLFGSDNNQLATTAVSKNGGSNVNTCDSGDCVATGTPSGTVATVNFQTTASTTDVTVGYKDAKTIGTGDLSGNEYKDINGSSEATITFSDAQNEYWVDTLVLGFKNTLYLQAGGTYWINQLTMDSQVDIIVQGSGTALIYVNQSFTFPSPGLINSPSNNNTGDASKLVMYVLSDVTFDNQSTYTGSLYVEGNLRLGSSSHAFGAISAADIQLESQSTITYQSSEVADTDFMGMCDVFAPLLEYRFDELSWDGTAAELIDSSINSLNGQSVGGTLSEDAQLCTGATFDGVNDHFVVPPISTDFSSGFSAMAWVDFGSTNSWERIFDFGNGAANNNIVFTRQGTSNDLTFVIFNGGASCGHIKANNGIVSGRHHYAVAVASDNTVVLYRDGAAIVSGTTACLPPNVTRNSNYIGRSNWNNDEYFESEIDELKVFDSTLTATNISNIYNNENTGNNYDSTARTCPTPDVHHYRIEHDTQGFTCEAEAMTIKACADANCDTSYDQEATITLSDLGLAGDGWMSGNEITIPAGTDIPITLSITDERSVNFSKTSASPNVDLRCFNGSTETCDMTFSNDGFELYGANIGDSLPDQKAADNFKNVNLRAVRSNNNVCEALLQGTQNIDLTYDCDSPDQCLTPLSGIAIDGDGSGGNTGTLTVLFDALGVANLSGLNYPDAGRLTLSVQAEVNGVTFNSSDSKTVDVYPSYLKLTVDQSELLYGSSGAQNNYIAGEPFTVSIGAYGVNDTLLPNYQSESPQLKVTRIQPASSGVDGSFKYAASGSSSAQLTASFSTATGLSFNAGEHQYTSAYYDEVGRINIDVRDNTYLGNTISSNVSITLGDFYPAYFDVTLSTTPSLADTCGIFSYLGENIDFETDPEFTITAYNALDEITDNYSDTFWNYLPDEQVLEASLSYLDSSSYTLTGTASVIDLGNAPLVNNNDNYDGSGTVTITNGRFKYNKVHTDNSAFDLVSPFQASINMVFASGFYTTSFAGQGGNHTICYKDNYNSSNCKQMTIENVLGTEIRYGRLDIESTHGSEFESLRVPIKTEYFKNDLWVLNTDDSNCTNIDFSQDNNDMSLLPIGSQDISASINNITSTGQLLLGVAVSSDDLLMNPPNEVGELILQLNPLATPSGWPSYLNYDWNGDNVIDENDFPSATVTFGLFRGNDKIIQWREVFN